MFNDLSSPAALLATRRSGKARDLALPGPDPVQLSAILAAAMRVPDHGKLAPWRFVVIDTDQRGAFADVLVSAYRAERPDAARLEIETMENFARQSPCLIVLLSTPVQPHKIPLWEQQLSAGAAAMQLLNAVHAQGFTANWLTGWPASNAEVLHRLGGTGPADRIAGFFFVGTTTRELEERPRPDPAAVVSHWQG